MKKVSVADISCDEKNKTMKQMHMPARIFYYFPKGMSTSKLGRGCCSSGNKVQNNNSIHSKRYLFSLNLFGMMKNLIQRRLSSLLTSETWCQKQDYLSDSYNFFPTLTFFTGHNKTAEGNLTLFYYLYFINA